MRRTIGLLLAGVLALLVGAVPAHGQGSDVSLSLDPDRVAPGGTFTVTGSCGPTVAGEPVPIILGGGIEGGQLVEVTTGASGEFTAAVSIPGDAPTGTGTVFAGCGLGSEIDPRAELTISTAVQSDPDVYAFGPAPFLGSTGSIELNSPIVDLASTAGVEGYWEASADGGVFAYGDAAFHGSAGAIPLAAPIVGISPTPGGAGYWLFAADGGVFSFGDAQFHGSMGGVDLVAPVVDGRAASDGEGYWMVAADGGVFSFGSATFHGSAADLPLVAPIVAINAPGGGGGYWLTAADGGIFAYGAIPFHGSAGDITLNQPIVDLAVPNEEGGYFLAGRDGGVFTYGAADFFGSLTDQMLDEDVVAVEAYAGGGYWLATEGLSGLQPIGNPSTEPKQSVEFPSLEGETGFLADVRLGGHQTFDRLVFEFDGGVPSWSVKFVETPVLGDPSGLPVAVDGEAFLEVVMSPASAVDLTGEQPEESFEPDRIDPPEVSIAEELVKTGDFESVLTWVVGLEERVPFSVTTLDDPSRLVIDLVTS